MAGVVRDATDMETVITRGRAGECPPHTWGLGLHCSQGPNDCHVYLSSYEARSSDRRAYDRRYCENYRRNGYSRERGDVYYEAEYRHSYDCRRSRDDSYRSGKSSRRKQKRRKRRTRSYSQSSSVSIPRSSSPYVSHPVLSLKQDWVSVPLCHALLGGSHGEMGAQTCLLHELYGCSHPYSVCTRLICSAGPATLGGFTWVSSVPAKCEFPASVMAGEAATYTFGLQCPACSMAGCLYDYLYLEPLLVEWVIVGLQSRWVGGLKSKGDRPYTLDEH